MSSQAECPLSRPCCAFRGRCRVPPTRAGLRPPQAWLDEDRLLVNTGDDFDGAVIYDASGERQPGPELPHMGYFDSARAISPMELYSEHQNAIISLETGETRWSCFPRYLEGTAAAGYVVYDTATRVVMKHY